MADAGAVGHEPADPLLHGRAGRGLPQVAQPWVLTEHLPQPPGMRRLAGIGEVSGDQVVGAGEHESAATAGRKILEDHEELDRAQVVVRLRWHEVVVPGAAPWQVPLCGSGGEGHQGAAPSAGWMPTADADQVIDGRAERAT